MPCRDRGLCLGSSLGTRDSCSGPRGSADAAGLREGLCKAGKTDAADAEAIAEAVSCQTMRFVAVETTAQQAVFMLHKTRDLLVRQRTMLVNALRGYLGDFAIVDPQASRVFRWRALHHPGA